LELLTVPASTGIPNNSEEPGTPIAAGKCPKVTKRPQGRFLHSIFRIVLIAHQPARQPIGGIKMGQHNLVKTFTDR
jgi:hypothetical protein